MRLQDFADSPTGKVAKTRDGFWAFTPNPLPPQVSISWSLSKALSDADRALSELSGTGRLLPNPSLLISAFVKKEAVLSSKIEGTVTLLDDLLPYEADPRLHPPSADWREVWNYVVAMNQGLRRIKELPIGSRLVRELHGILMKRARGKDKSPGEFRKRQNYIAGKGPLIENADYVPPPPELVVPAISAWEKYLHSEPEVPVLVQCAFMHYQFEAIHPFEDGNGRIGRLLIPFFLCDNGYLSQPLIYPSAFFERNREEYYRCLLEVSQNGAWAQWIAFFVRGMAEHGQEALALIRSLLDVHAEYKKRVMADHPSETTLRIIDHLLSNPVVSVSRLAMQWKRTFPTVQKSVDRLVRIGILSEITGQARNRIYAAKELRRLITTGKK